MNTEEHRLLTEFLNQLEQVRGIAKDPEADALIRQAVARQPDAAYLLVQKALLQNQALQGAKAQIDQLQEQISQRQPQARTGNSFLANDPWTRPAPPSVLPAYGAPPAAHSGGPSALSGFLGTAAATAAGIAGGAFLVQGIENLLGHHGTSGGFFDTASAAPGPVENVTINEYYGSDDAAPDYQQADFDDSDSGFDEFDDGGSLDV
jgi:hypothetical protein